MAANHPIHIHPARPLYRFTATALGASMWFFLMYRAKKDGPALLGWKHPWDHWWPLHMWINTMSVSIRLYSPIFQDYHLSSGNERRDSKSSHTVRSYRSIALPLISNAMYVSKTKAHVSISSSSTLYWRRCLRFPGRSRVFKWPIARESRGKNLRSVTHESRNVLVASAKSQNAKPLDMNVSCIVSIIHSGGSKSM